MFYTSREGFGNNGPLYDIPCPAPAVPGHLMVRSAGLSMESFGEYLLEDIPGSGCWYLKGDSNDPEPDTIGWINWKYWELPKTQSNSNSHSYHFLPPSFVFSGPHTHIYCKNVQRKTLYEQGQNTEGPSFQLKMLCLWKCNGIVVCWLLDILQY